MDANKLKVLQDIDYTIRKVCGNCRFFNKGRHDFGTCRTLQYNHLKHNNSTRELSVHQHGYCEEYKDVAFPNLGTYKQFQEDKVDVS